MQVGRAGRDGLEAQCHLLLDPKGADLLELRRHILSNAADRHVIRRLLTRLFLKCACEAGECQKHEVAFSAAETVTALDLPEENIATLLCYLELHSNDLIEVCYSVIEACKF